MIAADVVSLLASSRRAMQLYPPTHPAFEEAFGGLVDAVSSATAAGPLTLNLHNGRLYHESIVLPDDLNGHAAVAEAFESRSLQSLSLAPGFVLGDATGLVEVLSLRPSPDLDVEAELESRGVRAVKVALLAENDEEREERDRQRQADRALYQRLAAALRDLSGRMATGAAPDVGKAADLVGNVLSRLVEDAPAVMALATMRGTSERSLFHSLNVMIYALALGQKLGLPEEGLASLGMAAMLHDVGKAAFDEVPEQAEPMRLMHPKVGAEILQRLSLEDPAAMLVAYEHHMYVDGTGWPERGTDYIAHPYSRMVMIADRFESLTNAPAGTDSMTPDKAVVQVLREAGSLLDPFFARLFANAMGVFPIGCLVRLSDQSVGVVCRPGEDPLAPVVRVAFDAKGAELDDAEEVDLASGDVRIVEVIDPEALAVEIAEKL